MLEPLALTGLDPEVNGFLLNDGPSARKVGMADVVRVVVRGEHIGKVEIAILAHGHPFILFDVQDLCGGRGRQEGRSQDPPSKKTFPSAPPPPQAAALHGHPLLFIQ